MSLVAPAEAMDRMYRHQRHIYDLSRKYYLLGRDRLIADLDPPAGGRVLEIGCGTGRNLIHAARAHPQAAFFGVDVSRAMLETAGAEVARAGLSGRIRFAAADATNFDPQALFGVARFDRIFISYALSMIPPWRAALAQAADLVAPGGTLHIVDFGNGAELPPWFRSLLHRWLALFHVTPRVDLATELADVAAARGLSHEFTSLYRGYAALARVGGKAPASSG